MRAQSFDAASIRIEKSLPVLYSDRSLEDGPPPPPAPPVIIASPGRLTMRNIDLRSCVRWAWNLNWENVSAPTWAQRTKYQIVAVTGAKIPESEMRPMLRTLLQERFHLKTHFERQEHQITRLEIAKGGIKFRESTAAQFSYQRILAPGAPRRQIWKHASLEAVASSLSFPASGIIVDVTGLRGYYDLSLTWPAMTHGSPGDFYLAWRDALERQLGLTMRLGRGQADVLVIDRADEIPTPN